MNDQYDNELKGVLFKNTRKEHERQPDYKGNATIDGVKYWVAGWIRTSPKVSGKYMSLAFTEKEREFEPGSKDNQPSQDFDDDIPF